MTEKPTSSLFGRKWKALVLDPSGREAWNVSDSDWSNEALKCTFRVEKALMHCPWYAELTIWNLAGDTEADILGSCNQGASVILEAGYQSGNYGKIFDGSVFQPLFDRDNVTDFILTLNCMDGFGIITANLCSFTLEAGYDYTAMLIKMAKNARTQIPMGKISDRVSSQKLPRGKTFFGDPQKYLRQAAQANNGQWYYGDGSMNLLSIDDELAYEDKAIDLTPETGIIGTPQQTQHGVTFTTLLDPRITVKNPAMVVKIDNNTIRQTKARYGQPPFSPLDQDGYYKIIRVEHLGDTRGNEWYTRCTGINLAGNFSALLGIYQN